MELQIRHGVRSLKVQYPGGNVRKVIISVFPVLFSRKSKKNYFSNETNITGRIAEGKRYPKKNSPHGQRHKFL